MSNHVRHYGTPMDMRMPRHERAVKRAEKAAEHILGAIMRRRRWSATDRDAIADYVARFAREEINAAAALNQPKGE